VLCLKVEITEGIPMAKVWRRRSPYLFRLALVWMWLGFLVVIVAFNRSPPAECRPFMCEACTPAQLSYGEHALLCERRLAAAGGGGATDAMLKVWTPV